MATQPVVTEEQKTNQPERGVDPKDGIEKFVYRYQPRDSEGQFLGKEYKYFYTDQQDLVRQITEGKEQGDRFIHEVKSGKRKLAGEPEVQRPTFQPEAPKPEEQKPRDDWRRTAEQELGAPLESVRETLKRATRLEEGFAAYNWALNKQAEGYYPCNENSQKIAAWLKEKKYAFTPANYDLAFEELRDSLVQAPKEQAPSADSTQQQPPTRTEETKPRSTGIMPGQFAGTRQPNGTERPPLTKERFREINKMSRDQWKKFERTNPKEAEAYLKMKFAQPQQ